MPEPVERVCHSVRPPARLPRACFSVYLSLSLYIYAIKPHYNSSSSWIHTPHESSSLSAARAEMSRVTGSQYRARTHTIIYMALRERERERRLRWCIKKRIHVFCVAAFIEFAVAREILLIASVLCSPENVKNERRMVTEIKSLMCMWQPNGGKTQPLVVKHMLLFMRTFSKGWKVEEKFI